MESWAYIIGDMLVTLCVFVIAWKSEHPWKWIALLPIGNLWLLIDMADAPLWYIFLFGIPIVGYILWIYLWMQVAENTNKPSSLGYLMAIPLVNVGVAAYMAFYEPADVKA